MSNYSRGAAFENQVKHDLERKGYQAFRVAGSHSPVDVLAIGHGLIVYVQCKTNGVLRVEEWNSFIDFCSTVRALPILAEREKGIRYHLITGKKDGTKKKQPMEDIQL